MFYFLLIILSSAKAVFYPGQSKNERLTERINNHILLNGP